jgi:hypothetical protein
MHRLYAFALLAACTPDATLRENLSDDGLTVHEVERTGYPGDYRFYGVDAEGLACEGTATVLPMYTQRSSRCGSGIARRCLPTDPDGCYALARAAFDRDVRMSADLAERGCHYGGNCAYFASEFGWRFTLTLGRIGCARGEPLACYAVADGAWTGGRHLEAEAAAARVVEERPADELFHLSKRMAPGIGEVIARGACRKDPSLDGCAALVN